MTSTAFPVSVKGVVVRANRVLLLRNERDEWELPGGRLMHNLTSAWNQAHLGKAIVKSRTKNFQADIDAYGNEVVQAETPVRRQPADPER